MDTDIKRDLRSLFSSRGEVSFATPETVSKSQGIISKAASLQKVRLAELSIWTKALL